MNFFKVGKDHLGKTLMKFTDPFNLIQILNLITAILVTCYGSIGLVVTGLPAKISETSNCFIGNKKL